MWISFIEWTTYLYIEKGVFHNKIPCKDIFWKISIQSWVLRSMNKHYLSLPRLKTKLHHSLVSLSRCQTLRQDVARDVTSWHVRPAWRIWWTQFDCERTIVYAIHSRLSFFWVVLQPCRASCLAEKIESEDLSPLCRDLYSSYGDAIEAPVKHSIVRRLGGGLLVGVVFVNSCYYHA